MSDADVDDGDAISLCLQTLIQDLAITSIGWSRFHGLDLYFSERVRYRAYYSTSLWSMNLDFYSNESTTTTLSQGRPCVDFPMNYCLMGEKAICLSFRSKINKRILVVLTGFADRIRLIFDDVENIDIPALSPIFTLTITTLTA